MNYQEVRDELLKVQKEIAKLPSANLIWLLRIMPTRLVKFTK